MSPPTLSRHDSSQAQSVANGRHWDRRARLLAAEINVGWWLSAWLPWAVGIGLVGTFAVVWARSRSVDLVRPTWGAIGVALMAAAVIAWIRSRARFETVASARIRLEDRLGLHARLSSAAAGVGAWPGRRIDLDGRWPVRVTLVRPALFIGLIVGMFAVAMVIPLADAGAVRRHSIEPPADAEVVTRWLDAARRERAIDDLSARDVSERIESILERPSDTWYEHASLEAAGTLREQTAADLAELGRNLADTERAAADLAAAERQQRDATTLRAASTALAATAGKLALGGLRPASDTASSLGRTTAETLADLSPDELEALAQALRANRDRLKTALAATKDFDLSTLGPDADDALEGNCDSCKPCGECQACKDGKPCRKGACAGCASRLAGRGGLNRGPGEAAMRAGKEADLASRRTEQIEAPTDIARAAAGELLDIVDGEHTVDEKAYRGPQVGGAATIKGDAGGATRVDNLLPREQDAVRRFFK
jgi:hypothetical protein